MGILKRLTRGRGSPPTWCAHLTANQYAIFRDDVRSIAGRDLSSDPELADPVYAEGYYGLVGLARLAGRMPDPVWSQGVREWLVRANELKASGDATEARSGTLESALPNLRLALCRAEQVPPGDLGVPSVLPGCTDVLSLDTGPSVRNVPDRLALKWATPIPELVAMAEGRVLGLPRDGASRAAAGRPLVKSVSVEQHGPYAGPLLRHLPDVVPDAVGLLGTLVGAPAGGGFFYVALDPTATLRRDLLDLVLLHETVLTKSARPLAKLPHWRRPDGTFVEVPLKLDRQDGVVGSFHPGFEGVLTALDPLTFLPVPNWAQGTLSIPEYTRFAGIVSATRDVPPAQVELLGSAWALAQLAIRCQRLELEAWPATIGSYLTSMTADLASAQSIVDGWRADPGAVRDNLGVYLALETSVTAGMTARATQVPGLVEILCVYAHEATCHVPPDVAAELGPADDLFAAGERHVRDRIASKSEATPFLSAVAVTVESRPAASAILTHVLDWVPAAAGPGGALVSIGRSEVLIALPVADRSFVLDLPAFTGIAFGQFEAAEWPTTQAAYWVRSDGISAIEARLGPTGRVIGVIADADLARRAMELPEGPMLPGVAEVLGEADARRFLGLLRGSILEELAAGRAPIVLTAANIRDFAGWCGEAAPERWGEVIRNRLADSEPDGSALDALEDGTDVAAVLGVLSVRAEVGIAGRGPAVRKPILGGLVAQLVMAVGTRRREVRHRMLRHWGITEQSAWAAAGANLAALPGVVDEPMEGAPSFCRQIYHSEFEAEAVGLFLHLRMPMTRRGFVVSITHGSRAHYLRLDDPGSIAMIPVFANVVRGIYTEAAKHQDAKSSWLLWLRPDGELVPLFDVLQPTPPVSELPAGIRSMTLS